MERKWKERREKRKGKKGISDKPVKVKNDIRENLKYDNKAGWLSG